MADLGPAGFTLIIFIGVLAGLVGVYGTVAMLRRRRLQGLRR